MLPAATFADNKQLSQGEVAYHNTFPISQSEAYDILLPIRTTQIQLLCQIP